MPGQNSNLEHSHRYLIENLPELMGFYWLRRETGK